MRRDHVAFWLFAGGVLVISLAVFWSLSAYGEVGRMVASKGLRPNNAFACFVAWPERCALLDAAHAEKGTIAYSPLAFWAGIAMILVSFVLQLLPRSAGEPWLPRLQRLLLPVDRVSTLVGQIFAWAILLLTLAVSYEVFSRYVLGRPTDWAFDASYILYGTLFIMAGAYALARNAHVRGDFLYRAWRPQRQALMDLILYFLFFFPGIIAFIYSGYGFAAQSWFSHEHSAYSPSARRSITTRRSFRSPASCSCCKASSRRSAASSACAPANGRNGCMTSKNSRRSSSSSTPKEHARDRSATWRADARPLRRAHHARLPDRLHADGDGRRLRASRLRRQSGAGDVAPRAAHLVGDDQRHPHLRAALRVHGLHHRARQHSRPAVPLGAARRRRRARVAGGGDAHHLCAVRDRDRNRRRGGDADGASRLSGHAEARL